MKKQVIAFLTGLCLFGYSNILSAKTEEIRDSRPATGIYSLEESVLIENNQPLIPLAEETKKKPRPTLENLTKALENDGYTFQDMENALADEGMPILRKEIASNHFDFYFQNTSHNKGKSAKINPINSGEMGFGMGFSLSEWAGWMSYKLGWRDSVPKHPTFDLRFDYQQQLWFGELQVGDSWKAEIAATTFCPSFTFLYRPFSEDKNRKENIFGIDSELLDSAIGLTNRHCSWRIYEEESLEEAQQLFLSDPDIDVSEVTDRNIVMLWAANKYAFANKKLELDTLLGWTPHEAKLNDTLKSILNDDVRTRSYPFPYRIQIDSKYNFAPATHFLAGGWIELDNDFHYEPWELRAGIALLSHKGNGLSLTLGKNGGKDNKVYVLGDGFHTLGDDMRLSYHHNF